MKYKLGDDWLDWALTIEDEGNFDISAGPVLGKDFVQYFFGTGHARPITETLVIQEAVQEALEEKLGDILNAELLSSVVGEVQGRVWHRLNERKPNSISVA
jgi:hypothetical protein